MTGRTHGWFEVESLVGPRFELALEFFQAGRAFIFEGVAFARHSDRVECIVPSSWMQPTSDTAYADLARGEQMLERLRQRSPKFARMSEGLPCVFVLVQDTGMGTVTLAERRDGVLRWTAGGGGSK